MRHEPEFNLAIVSRKEETSVIGYDRFADKTASLRPNGQVLQVGIAGREASGSRHGLVIGGVDFSVLGVYVPGKGRDVRSDKLV
jgi:hypothetical protein